MLSKLFHSKLRHLSFHYGFSFSLGQPNVSQIEITNACNYQCKMCPHKDMTRSVEYMDFCLYKKIIGKLYSSNGVIYLHFLGEPFLHPSLEKFILYGKSKGYEIGISTNGSLLTEENSKKIIDADLDYLVISFEINEETFKILRSGGDFKTVQKNILNFFTLKKLKWRI